MKVTLERTYPMPCDVDAAWQLLQDIEAVATCMPGASITERVDDTHYKGAISVKIGPASMAFKGQITVAGIDAANHTVHLIGTGTDTTGTSGASMDLVATVNADGDRCELVGKSEVSLNGKAAAFGGRMMNVVADQLLKQFAANFASRVQSTSTPQNSLAEPGIPAAGGHRAESSGAPQQKQLNGLGLLWAIIADWFRRFFAGKSA
jgi:carbon monoxide dehydrogenase subunit G